MQQYRHNHYVPIFYQRRFMLRGQSRYYRLDLKPEILSDRGVKYTRKDLHHWGPANVFAQDDLYTTKWGSAENREIEQFFFGQLDTTGPAAIDFICNFDHANQNYNEPLFRQFLTYMSVQKLRTPKGLEAFGAQVDTNNKNEALIELQRMQDLHCATWTECVWANCGRVPISNEIYYFRSPRHCL